MKKFIVFLSWLMIAISPTVLAQIRPSGIANLDSFKARIREGGLDKALTEVYRQRIQQHINSFEQNFASLEYEADSVNAIIFNTMRENHNEAIVNLIDMTHGVKTLGMRPFSLVIRKFKGSLSPEIEKQAFDLLDSANKNKGSLMALKAASPDFVADMEKILINEVNVDGRVDKLVRNIIYERAKGRLSGVIVVGLNDKDALTQKINERLVTYLMARFQNVLSKKSTVELLKIIETVDRY